MLQQLIAFLTHNRLVTFLLAALIVFFGLTYAPFSWTEKILNSNPIPVDAIPDIGENQQIISTPWEGKSAHDIENQITYPLTTSLQGIAGVKTIRSSSMFGLSTINIIFEEDVDFYWARTRILEKLNALPANLLPEEANPSLGPDATGLGQVYWYTLEGRDADGNPTGGWDLNELRSIQDYYVKFGLAGTQGVSEVSSIGGHVQEYQVDIDPEKIRQWSVRPQDIVAVLKKTNKETGAQTLELNQAEYIIRGLGYIQSIEDIEETVVFEDNNRPVKIKDVANVELGPSPRRGILDKEGAEVAGGVVVARYGENPMEVLQNLHEKVESVSEGLPKKTLADGTASKLEIVPFYDRSELIEETVNTLDEALIFEILITCLVVLFLIRNFKASLLISSMLPLAVLLVFIGMKLGGVDANIVALSGIAIAIGSMVDIGIVLVENAVEFIEKNKKLKNPKPISTVVLAATKEVSGAVITTIATTVVSFLPILFMTGAEGKLFRPLAITKTMALVATLLVGLFLIPAATSLAWQKRKTWVLPTVSIGLLLLGSYITFFHHPAAGSVVLFFGIVELMKWQEWGSKGLRKNILFFVSIFTLVYLLAVYWAPLGYQAGTFGNFLAVAIVFGGMLVFFQYFEKWYPNLLLLCLQHKLIFLSLPVGLLIIGLVVFKNTGREFMPALDEGSFLLMPTSLPHSGTEENKRVLQLLDMAVASLPEVETVVGKAGRAESALDPAPLSMYENIITYKPEYSKDKQGKRRKFKVDSNENFILNSGKTLANQLGSKPEKANYSLSEYRGDTEKSLVADPSGKAFRNWRPEIRHPQDIWDEIARVTKLPGVTSAPKLQPIETRMIMLQTGMRAPMGMRIKGTSQKEIESFGLDLEPILKSVPGVKESAVFTERSTGKPYLTIDIDRQKLAPYGLHIEDVQDIIQIAIGRKQATQTIEGRERYSVRVRYPRELRDSPEAIKKIWVPLPDGGSIPLGEVADVAYEKGPENINSEDGFLVNHVIFDKKGDHSEVKVVEAAQEAIDKAIEQGEIEVPPGIQFEFAGSYENHIHSQKTLQVILPFTLLIIFILLYLQFRSTKTALIVFSSVAVALSGGLIYMWLYSQPWFMNINFNNTNLRELYLMDPINLSVAVWVGFIALFGVAVDDGVLLATYLNQNFAKKKPQSYEEIHQLVLKAGKRRIRACLLTTATTLMALLPILTSTGKGSDIMKPMAIPLFGGMSIVMITLFIVPTLYGWAKEKEFKKLNS